MALFDLAIGPLLEEEGRRVVPSDNGRGPSRYGVTLLTYQEFKPEATAADIYRLTKMQATTFYRWWWVRWKYGLVDDQEVANKLFDLGVNQGAGLVIKFAQRAVGTRDDGILGPKTAIAINARTPKLVLQGIRTAGAQHYQELVQRRPDLAPALEGWLIRLAK
jgi:lysozyme family protein